MSWSFSFLIYLCSGSGDGEHLWNWAYSAVLHRSLSVCARVCVCACALLCRGTWGRKGVGDKEQEVKWDMLSGDSLLIIQLLCEKAFLILRWNHCHWVRFPPLPASSVQMIYRLRFYRSSLRINIRCSYQFYLCSEPVLLKWSNSTYPVPCMEWKSIWGQCWQLRRFLEEEIGFSV